MSSLEIGFLIGLILGLTHTGALAIGLWLRERHWKGIRERAGL